jgi:SAM-dependent methyltransferase
MLKSLKILKRLLRPEGKHSELDISGPFMCSVCKSEGVGMEPLPIYYFKELHKYQYIHNIFLSETINFEHYSCKKCGASDRDRLFALYLNDYLNRSCTISLLDIAPASALANFILTFGNVKYRSMDLYMEGVDDKIDVTNMHTYKDNQFDFFICSHVLEHIPNDLNAMEELYRVLKPGGRGIAMVPINLGLETTFEDTTITSIADKWKYFGQDDHVRQYAKKDYISRLEKVGFKVDLFDLKYFGKDVFMQHAIFPTSVLYIVTK